MTKENPANLRVGDIVEIKFLSEQSFTARITKIEERYKSDGIYYDEITPRVGKQAEWHKNRNLDNFCDISWAKLIERGPWNTQPQIKQIKAWSSPRVKDTGYEYFYYDNKHYLTGHPFELAIWILSKKQIHLPLGLSENRFNTEFIKTRMYLCLYPGKSKFSRFIVRRTTFTRWLMRALPKIIGTKTEMRVSGKEQEAWKEKQYEAEIKEDMDREMERWGTL